MSTTAIPALASPNAPLDRRPAPEERPAPAPAARTPEPPAARPAPPVARRPIATAYTVDQATRSLVYQVTSTTSGDVVFQSPSEDALRARAYAESVDRQRIEHPPQSDKPATVIA